MDGSTPSSITTDCGAQFESSLWCHLTQLLGSKKIRTTAYHPSSNRLTERFHRQLKAGLKATLDSTHWVAALPMVLLGICTSLKQDIGCCAAELVYGTTLRLPGEFFSFKQGHTPRSSHLYQPIEELHAAVAATSGECKAH